MGLSFKKISNDEELVDYLGSTLASHLNNSEAVLWLVPGGSAIGIVTAVAKRLKGIGLKNLTVTLTDERYGLVGHADSNWQQLLDAGLALAGAQTIPVLNGKDLQTTSDAWENQLRDLLDKSNYSIGLFGIGPDGHTSGILPGSPAVTAMGLVCAYDGGAFQRITTTPNALLKLNEAVVYAMGEAKHSTLDRLEQDLDVTTQPAQILKHLPKTTIFNDYKEKTI